MHKKTDFIFSSYEIKNESYRGHFEFQKKTMLDEKLLFSGPLDGAGGLYFFSPDKFTKKSVKEFVQDDPLVKIGLFTPEIHKLSIPQFMIQVTEKIQKL